MEYQIKRTITSDLDFIQLVTLLDHELWEELKEDQATYDQFNKVAHLKTAVIMYINEKPVAIGCFKKRNEDTIEIKRMYVVKAYRSKGLAKHVLHHLEQWAVEYGYQYAILETSIHFEKAKSLYRNNGYKVTDNYPPYVGLEDSVCMKKQLQKK